MLLSDLSVRRPVLASVISLLLIAFGLVSFDRLALREYPDIDPPVVSVETSYTGAAAAIVETRVTQVIEDVIAGVEGIRSIESSSEDGRSNIIIEFTTDREVDDAANDIRDRVAGVLDDLPEEADPPEVQKQDADSEPIMWLNLQSDRMGVLELSDYARRYLQDRFAALPGVARVRVGGGLEYAMRIWIDRQELAARALTISDIESALRRENVELPAGQVESRSRVFTARLDRSYGSAEDFRNLIVAEGDDGHLVRLADVARVEKAAAEDRLSFRGNGSPMVGVGIVKQSTANTIDVSDAVQRLAAQINRTLPPGTSLERSYDSSIFVRAAIAEVYTTLAIAVLLVVGVIYLFLRDVRAMLIPAVTVPVSLLATFIALSAFGLSINLITLLALVLAVGIVVDDSIVVLENTARRIELGETPLVAAFLGTRQVAFAVIATSIVLVAVFVPLAFLRGDLGRLFSEFAITMAAAVAFSSLVALTLTPMLASKLLRSRAVEHDRTPAQEGGFFSPVRSAYRVSLTVLLARPLAVLAAFALLLVATLFLLRAVPSEYAPHEDRGAFFAVVSGPEGASYEFMKDYMDQIEGRLMRFVENGEAQRLLARVPSFFGGDRFNAGIIIVLLSDWSERRPADRIMEEVRQRTSDLPGVRVFPVMRQGLGRGVSKPVQFVLGGPTYDQLAAWRDEINVAIEANPGLIGVDWDYKETQPQLRIRVDRNRAGDLGVPLQEVGRTLESLLGSRRVTTFIDNGEEYDVIIQGERALNRTPESLDHVYVRSQRSGQLVPLANLVTIEESADSNSLSRYNRVRAITLEANLAETLTLGEALTFLEGVTRKIAPEATIDYKGISSDLRQASGSIAFVFLLGLCVVFLALAAQFESYVHPLVIILTVPLALGGGLFGLWVSGGTLNIYSQIGLIMLVGLAAKNGILIVEFANQLRDEGVAFSEALLEAATVRLRPIVMTGITTAAGAIPLLVSGGAGSETRQTIGVVVFCGVIAATLFTIYVVPVAYQALARHTGSPGRVGERLARELAQAAPEAELRST